MFWPQHEPQASRATLPRHITIRRGTIEDEHATFEVMRRTMGHEMAWSHHASARRHLQTTDNSSCWIAEEKQLFTSARIVGYARSVVRECVWTLTEFFVLPGHHRHGIGGALLARCMEDGESLGADTRVILASQHAGANSLYVRKLGCFPRIPMMMLVGPLSKLRAPEGGLCKIVESVLPFASIATMKGSSPRVGAEFLKAEPLILTDEVMHAMGELDRRIVGYARPEEHQFWADQMGGRSGASRIFRRVWRSPEGVDEIGAITGYAYLGPYSSGPALAEDPQHLTHLLAHVAGLSIALTDNDADIIQPLDQYWALAGTNEITLRWLLECGWEVVFHYLFMSTRPIGSFDRYVGYNPLYFL